MLLAVRGALPVAQLPDKNETNIISGSRAERHPVLVVAATSANIWRLPIERSQRQLTSIVISSSHGSKTLFLTDLVTL
jgi:hypothetical protein